MNDRYHRAARDGHVTILKEASRKELNAEDEDGMSPVMWASHHGNLEALRVILGRGGDPDKCGIWGNSPLHLAAANGHLDCLSFLVSFGANVWCLDNDFHTPLDEAAVRGHMDAVRYLDSVAAKQSAINPKLVRKLKQRAFCNAEQRIKHCAQLQHHNQRRMEKKFLREAVGSRAAATVRFSMSYARNIPQFNTVHSGIAYTQAMLNSTPKDRTKIPKYLEKKEKKQQADGSFKISEDGRKSVRSLSGLQMGNDVMFLKHDTFSNPRHRLDVRNMFPQNPQHHDDDDVTAVSHAASDPGLYNHPGEDSLFSRPGLGTLVFRRNYSHDGVQEAYGAGGGGEESWREENTYDSERLHLRHSGLDQEKCSSSASLQSRYSKAFFPWACFDDDDDEDDGDYEVEYDDLQPCSSPLEVFLVSQGLGELLSLFLKQQMDLEALMLCTEPNLIIINVPLGPRKKLLEACSRRTHTLQRARAMCDTQL